MAGLGFGSRPYDKAAGGVTPENSPPRGGRPTIAMGGDMTERDLRVAICDVGRRLHDRGFVAAWDGNISARLPDGTVLCTPTMCPKGRLEPNGLCVVDGDGRQVR